MLNLDFLNDLSIKIKQLSASSPAADLEKNIQALLQSAFTKLNLVSREEFDIQANVLSRTKQQLELLEKHEDEC